MKKVMWLAVVAVLTLCGRAGAISRDDVVIAVLTMDVQKDRYTDEALHRALLEVDEYAELERMAIAALRDGRKFSAVELAVARVRCKNALDVLHKRAWYLIGSKMRSDAMGLIDEMLWEGVSGGKYGHYEARQMSAKYSAATAYLLVHARKQYASLLREFEKLEQYRLINQGTEP